MVQLNGQANAEQPARGGALAHIAEPLRTLAVPVDSLNLDPSNARTHPEKNLAAIKASLARFGQRQPVVVQREGMVVRAGNGRVMAARALGWTHVAALVVDESAIDATAFAIADNRTSDLAEWDDGTLARLLESLPSDLKEAAGYDDKDMKELLASLGGDVVEDEAPEPLPDPVSRRGDLWVLGGHRILCGDSTDGGDVALVMNGEKAALCLTDPPYGVGLAYASWNDSQEALVGLIEKFLPLARSVSTNVLLTPGAGNQYKYPAPSWTLCWRVPAAITRGPWGFISWQPVLAYVKDPFLSRGEGARPDAYDCNAASPDENHPCPKPMELWAWLVERGGAWRGDVVYEPFSGSGTTIIAAEQLGRRCFAIEIEPRYVDVAVRRWQKLTGKDATHADTGKTWAETAAERGVKTE